MVLGPTPLITYAPSKLIMMQHNDHDVRAHTQTTSPLTTHISGCRKTALQTLLGILIFKNKVSALTVARPLHGLPVPHSLPSLIPCHPRPPVSFRACQRHLTPSGPTPPPPPLPPLPDTVGLTSLCHTPEPKILNPTHEHARTKDDIGDTVPAHRQKIQVLLS